MAVTQGVGPHAAWLNVAGGTFPIESGDVIQNAKRRTSTFSGLIPMSYPGVAATLATLGDNTATITVLSRGATGTLVTGEIDEVNFDEIRREIHFSGRDKSAKLHEKKSSEKWVNKKPSDIVQDLIGRVGLTGIIAPSMVMAGKKLEQDYIKLTQNMPYAFIIHKMAEIDGARWWVDAKGTFHYVPFGSPDGTYSITINQNLEPISADCLSLQIRRNIHAGKTIKVTVKGWHPRKQKVFQHTATIHGNGGPVEYNYDVPTLLQPDVKQRARAHANEKALHELTVVSTLVGDLTLHAGMGLQLSGTNYFDQLYDIDDVRHQFGMSGYLTHLTARAPKQGRSTS